MMIFLIICHYLVVYVRTETDLGLQLLTNTLVSSSLQY